MTQALDPVTIESLRDLGESIGQDLLSEVSRLFLDRGEVRLDGMREGIAQEDLSAVERWAHSLKGSAGTLGAMDLSSLCADLERLAASGCSTGADQQLALIERSYALAQKEIQALIK